MFDLVRATRNAIEKRMSLSDFDSVLDMLASGGVPSYTGKQVSPLNAMQVGAVWACVNVLADDFATLPLPPYRWIDPGTSREEARDHYLWPLLMDQANPRMSAHRFKKTMETWRQLWGNAYAEIDSNGRGQITALWPWRPDRVRVWLKDPGDYRSEVYYTYFPVNRKYDPVTRGEHQMLHVRGISLDGIMGMTPVEVHRQTIGLSMAMTEHAGRFYSNGATVKNVLRHPGKLSDKAEASLRERMKEYRGVENAHKMLLLEEGMEFADVGMKMADAQFIESMNMADLDIARMYKVPAHRINMLDRATNNNIEQLAMEYVQYTLGPNAANWTGEIHASCLSGRERQSIFIEPDFTNLLNGDHAARAAYYTALSNVSGLSPDEIRMREGYNPLPGGIGKLPRAPLNTVPLGTPATLQPIDTSKKTNGVAALQ